jgi:hypothetical protein
MLMLVQFYLMDLILMIYPILFHRNKELQVYDHTSLLLSSGKGNRVKPSRFFIRAWWLGLPGFIDTMSAKLVEIAAHGQPQHNGVVDLWQN